MKIGSKILSKDGSYYAITEIQKYNVRTEVYNIEVENNHNYFVGNLEILVHNYGSSGAGESSNSGGDSGSSDDDDDDWREERIAEIKAELEEKERERAEYAKAESELRESYKEYSEGLESLKEGLKGEGVDEVINATANRINDVVELHNNTVSAINSIDKEINALHNELNSLGGSAPRPVRESLPTLSKPDGSANNNNSKFSYDRDSYNRALEKFDSANSHFNEALGTLHGAPNYSTRMENSIHQDYNTLNSLSFTLRIFQYRIENDEALLSGDVSNFVPKTTNLDNLLNSTYVTDLSQYYNHGHFNVTTGNKTYEMTDEQKLVFAAIVAAEMGQNYGPNDALAICSVVLNRCEMENWQQTGGTDPYAQITFGGVNHKYEFEAYYDGKHKKYIEGATTGNWDLREANPEKFEIAYKAMEDALHGVRNTLEFTEYHAPEGPNWDSDYHSIPSGNNFYTNDYDKRFTGGNPTLAPLSPRVEINNQGNITNLSSYNSNITTGTSNDFSSQVLSVEALEEFRENMNIDNDNIYNQQSLNNNNSNLSQNNSSKSDFERVMPASVPFIVSSLNKSSNSVSSVDYAKSSINPYAGGVKAEFNPTTSDNQTSSLPTDNLNWTPSYMRGSQPASPTAVSTVDYAKSGINPYAGGVKAEFSTTTSDNQTSSLPTDNLNWAPSYMGGNQPASPTAAKPVTKTDTSMDNLNWAPSYMGGNQPASPTAKKATNQVDITSLSYTSNSRNGTTTYSSQESVAHTPTGIPSYVPTGEPSYTPTGTPSYVPTGTPSYVPTGVPSYVPTGTPLYTPTRTPVVETQPTPVVETQPTPVVETQPTPVVETQPTPVVETQPTPVVETQPTPVVETQPTPVVETQPTPVVETQPTSTIIRKPIVQNSSKNNSSEIFNFQVDGTNVDVNYNNPVNSDNSVNESFDINSSNIESVYETPSFVLPTPEIQKQSHSNIGKVIGTTAVLGAAAVGAYGIKKVYDKNNNNNNEYDKDYIDDTKYVDTMEFNTNLDKIDQDEIDKYGLTTRKDTIVATEEDIL